VYRATKKTNGVERGGPIQKLEGEKETKVGGKKERKEDMAWEQGLTEMRRQNSSTIVMQKKN